MDDEIKELLKDLILINSIIATEALQITENTSKIARNSQEVPKACLKSHGALRKQVIEMLEKYFTKENLSNLSNHLIRH